MKKRFYAVLAATTLAVAAACGSAPTAPSATAGDWQADTSTTPPSDSTNTRVPNLMGSGN